MEEKSQITILKVHACLFTFSPNRSVLKNRPTENASRVRKYKSERTPFLPVTAVLPTTAADSAVRAT